MAPGMSMFVHRDDHATADQIATQRATSHGSRPPTAQRIHKTHDHHMHGTDTDDFDRTRSSFDPDGNEDPEAYIQNQHFSVDEQLLDDDQEESEEDEEAELKIPSKFLPTKDLDMQMKAMRHAKAQQANSYPSTTSGEPDYSEKPEANHSANLEHQNLRYDQHQMPYPHAAHVAVVKPPSPPQIDHSRHHFKTKVKPTVTQNDLAHQQELQSKPQSIAYHGNKSARVQSQAVDQSRVDHAHAAANRHHLQTSQNNINDQTIAAHRHQESSPSPEEIQEDDVLPVELDYDLEELHKKSFTDLQNDPFEGPPQADVKPAPADSSQMTLTERLETGATRDAQAQKELFASLNIEDWEEAGDWFQEQFANVLRKLKESRRERRKLASAFEQQIADRQVAVTKKRALTDDALSAMKKSGSQVLSGTPKKKQKPLQ
jgi:hypothetical protein